MNVNRIDFGFVWKPVSHSFSLCVCVSPTVRLLYTVMLCFAWMNAKRTTNHATVQRNEPLYFFLSSTVWFNRSRKSNWKKVIERATMKELQSRPPYIFIARKLQTNLHLSMECNINTIRNNNLMYLRMQTVHDQTQQYYFIIFQDMKLQCNCKMHK